MQRLRQDEGAYLDVLVPATGIRGWQALLDLPLRHGWLFKYCEYDGPQRLPGAVEAFARSATTGCRFEFEPSPGFTLTTAFWDQETPHLWFDPLAIGTKEDLELLYRFLRTLGRSQQADVLVTAEGSPERTYLRYDSHADRVEVVGSENE